MSILDRLLSALGLGGADDRGEREPTVTVEHEPDATDEAAVKGVEADDGTVSTAGADTDAAGAGESGVSGEPPGATADVEASGDESGADMETGADETGADESGADVETVADEAAEAATQPAAAEGEEGESVDPHAAAGADESAETVKGIGPAYADRLAAVGVETVGDLAAADATDLEERTSLSEKRISRWIERARARLDLD